MQGFGSRRRGVEVCGCGVVAAVTLILLVCCTVYVKFVNEFCVCVLFMYQCIEYIVVYVL